MSRNNRDITIFQILLSLALLLASCQYSENTLPVVIVDFEHDFMSQHVDKNVPIIQSYKIAAGHGFIVDTSNIEMQIPSQLIALNVTHPNKVVVYIRLGHYDSRFTAYYAEWKNSQTSFALSSQSLIPQEENAKPFSGLQSGQQVTVVIGYYDKDGQATERETFYPFWGGVVYVQ